LLLNKQRSFPSDKVTYREMNANRKKTVVEKKYKSTQQRTERQENKDHSMQWQSPLRRRLDRDGYVESITIRVRIRLADSERDFQCIAD
jgi:hypothetical protein